MRRTLAALAAAVLVLTTPAAAGATKPSTRKDPQGDVIGGAGLDMKKVQLERSGKDVVVTFTTWNAFSDDDLAFPGGLGVDFTVSKKLVRGAAVRSEDGAAYGEICSYKQGPKVPKAKNCSDVAVSRVSDTVYQLTVPLAVIDQGAKRLSWKASSMAANGSAGCMSGFCLDGVGSAKRLTTWKL